DGAVRLRLVDPLARLAGGPGHRRLRRPVPPVVPGEAHQLPLLYGSGHAVHGAGPGVRDAGPVGGPGGVRTITDPVAARRPDRAGVGGHVRVFLADPGRADGVMVRLAPADVAPLLGLSPGSETATASGRRLPEIPRAPSTPSPA